MKEHLRFSAANANLAVMSQAETSATRILRPLAERRRRFVVVMDDTKECHVALRFASARAAHVEGGVLVLFHVFQPAEFQHWKAVGDRMREEAFEEADAMLKRVSMQVADYCGIQPERIVRQGKPDEELRQYVEETADIFALFLGADTEGEPGPLVSYFSGPVIGSLHCPVVIVPGLLSDEEIDAMA